MSEVKHTISFIPDLNNKSSEIVVEFADKATKDEYIASELNFTQKAYDDYLVSSFAERMKAKQRLHAKRQEFATISGYVPKVTGGHVWVYRRFGNSPIRSA